MVVVREQEMAVRYRMRLIYIQGHCHVTGWSWARTVGRVEKNEIRSTNTWAVSTPTVCCASNEYHYDPMAEPPSFLTAIFREDVEIKQERPTVTLTFAQSLDAKIAGVGGKQLILSGRESMVMTHW